MLVQEFVPDGGICRGISENYVRVEFPGREEQVRTLVPVRIDAVRGLLVSGVASV